jgi:hypothetical protein
MSRFKTPIGLHLINMASEFVMRKWKVTVIT